MIQRIRHIITKTPLLLRVVPLYVLVIGAMMTPQLTQDKVEPNYTSTQTMAMASRPAEPVLPTAIEGKPVHISLPRIGLERTIVDGEYDSQLGDWTLTDDKVQYATMTGLASDQPGQTVLYGHNTVAVLEPVRLVQPGDELVVTTANGHKFHYSYVEDRVVEPTDVAVLYEQPEDKSRLVLMTCEGIFSSTRRLLYFDLQAVV